MANSELLKTISQLDRAGLDKTEIIETLISNGHSDQEIIDGINSHPFRVGGNVIGIFIIIMAVVVGASIKSTFGSFRYEFDSSGDFVRLNEWLLKPFLTVALLCAGINLVRSRNNVNFTMKVSLIVVFAIFTLVSAMANSSFPFFCGVVGIVLLAITRVPVLSTAEGTALLVKNLRAGTPPDENILKQTGGEPWRGSAVFLPLLFFGVLFINSPIMMQMAQTPNPYRYQSVEEIMSQVSTLDLALVWLLKALILATIVTGILMSINMFKYRHALMALTVLAFVHAVIVLFSSSFQSSFIPATGVVITAALFIWSKNLLTKVKVPQEVEVTVE